MPTRSPGWFAGISAWLLLAACGRVMCAPATLADCDADARATVLQAAAQTAALAARAVWFDRRTLRWPGVDSGGRFRLYYSDRAGIVAATGAAVHGADGDLDLGVYAGTLPAELAARFKYVGDGVTLALADADLPRIAALQRGQLILAHEDAQGIARDVSALQFAGALDDLYAAADDEPGLGATVSRKRVTFKLWAPTATSVSLCLYRGGSGPASAIEPMARADDTGIWLAVSDPSRWYYTYLVDVFVPGVGIVRNRVTDPYALSLGADSQRAYAVNPAAPAPKSLAAEAQSHAPAIEAQTDLAIYELHVRDFSANDPSVSAAHRGKYLAFTEAESDGMKHLRALAAAGVTDVHLLPVFDFASVPESGCVTPIPQGTPDGTTQQAAVAAVRASDCYNWGYDPYHFAAPEGSYATDAADGAVRVAEFRRMVQALHHAGLRVGMDLVYNHTSAAGQDPHSVLDRIVPGYYHRLDANGQIATSTCCANTATENRMMAKLMIDSAVVWARDYGIDSFRFDLMGHQPRAAMERLRERVNSATGREVQLIGEGWNFGEVKDGARFVQASQLSLNGSHIGTFNDRLRDAARGGGCCDNGDAQIRNQGFVNGLYYDRNALAPAGVTAADLMRSADLVRAGLAGSIRSYALRTYRDEDLPLERIDYSGQPAGYASQPDEAVNYVENHDNQTLFDLDAFKLPVATSREDRARTQILAAALVAFSQGIAYFHAGFDLLRSKSMDRNSFDSGDWFNRVDWRGTDNYFGNGLPPEPDNGPSWPLMKPLLANSEIKPTPAEIAWARDAFRDLLRIRASSTLFRLRSADDIKARLTFLNTGSGQVATVIAAHLDGHGYAGAGFKELLYFVNVDKQAHQLSLAGEQGKSYVLHPVHRDSGAADRRPASEASYDPAVGRFTIPPRTALVYAID